MYVCDRMRLDLHRTQMVLFLILRSLVYVFNITNTFLCETFYLHNIFIEIGVWGGREGISFSQHFQAWIYATKLAAAMNNQQ